MPNDTTWFIEFFQAPNAQRAYLKAAHEEGKGYYTRATKTAAAAMSLPAAKRTYKFIQDKAIAINDPLIDVRVVSAEDYVLEDCDYRLKPSPPPEEFFVYRTVAPKKTSDGSSFIYSFPTPWDQMYAPVRGQTCKEVLDKIFQTKTYQGFVDSLPPDPEEVAVKIVEKDPAKTNNQRLPNGAVLRPGSRRA